MTYYDEKPSWIDAPAWATHLLVRDARLPKEYAWAEGIGTGFYGATRAADGFSGLGRPLFAECHGWQVLESRPTAGPAVMSKPSLLGHVVNVEIKAAADLDTLEEHLRRLRMYHFPETLSWIHETPDGRLYQHSDKDRAERDRQVNGGQVYPAWMPANTKPDPQQSAPEAPAKQPPCPSLITDVNAAVLRLLSIPDDLCHDAERAERTYRQAEFNKALSAVSQALGLESQAVTPHLEGLE